MGKAAKAHRAKVAKRNNRLAAEKYKMQNALNKLMQEMAKQQIDAKGEQDLNITVGDSEVKFDIVQPEESNNPVDVEIMDSVDENKNEVEG
jgi:hypothetical protein